MKLNKYIDHTLLKADATKERILTLCQQAREYDFASVCVNTCWVKTCKEALKGTDVNVCTVVGFPLGAMSTEGKALETRQAVLDGANEIDMVINIGALKDKDYDYVIKDIAAVVKEAGDRVVKVIIETCLLTDEEKVAACECSIKGGAKFVKTSTGFSTGGATAEDVKLMYETVKDAGLKVKASGGIKTLADAEKMIEAGAERLGCSAGMQIMKDFEERQ
ncbi:MAG: deoxyribose-phosphate aldolase [Erysipelotrichaceae bacterium]|nr:deoxyribose-phosphate aldolase [Erysipelotrichaceae bacterium]